MDELAERGEKILGDVQKRVEYEKEAKGKVNHIWDNARMFHQIRGFTMAQGGAEISGTAAGLRFKLTESELEVEPGGIRSKKRKKETWKIGESSFEYLKILSDGEVVVVNSSSSRLEEVKRALDRLSLVVDDIFPPVKP